MVKKSKGGKVLQFFQFPVVSAQDRICVSAYTFMLHTLYKTWKCDLCELNGRKKRSRPCYI